MAPLAWHVALFCWNYISLHRSRSIINDGYIFSLFTSKEIKTNDTVVPWTTQYIDFYCGHSNNNNYAYWHNYSTKNELSLKRWLFRQISSSLPNVCIVWIYVWWNMVASFTECFGSWMMWTSLTFSKVTFIGKTIKAIWPPVNMYVYTYT